jgi:hypothetical protein
MVVNTTTSFSPTTVTPSFSPTPTATIAALDLAAVGWRSEMRREGGPVRVEADEDVHGVRACRPGHAEGDWADEAPPRHRALGCQAGRDR